MFLAWISILVSSCFASGAIYTKVSASENGRVNEAYTIGQMRALNPIVLRFFGTVVQADYVNDEWTPQVADDSVEERTPLGTVYLGNVSRAASFSSVAFILPDNRQIRYMHDCEKDYDGLTLFPHPLIVESAYMNEASRLNLAPSADFVSPAAYLPLNRTSLKLAFDMTDDEYARCVFNGGTVRYSIIGGLSDQMISMDKLFKNRYSSLRKQVSFAARLGATLIRAVKSFHGNKFILGNIGRRCLYLRKSSMKNFLPFFTHFAHASWVGNDTQSPTVRGAKSLRLDRTDMTSWELENGFAHHYSKRDDIVRVIKLVASVIFGEEYFAQQVLMTNANMIKWKRYGDLFSLPNANATSVHFVDQLEYTDDVTWSLKTAFYHLQQMARSEGVPDYDRIFAILEYIGKKTRDTDVGEQPPHPITASTVGGMLIPYLGTNDPELTPAGIIPLGELSGRPRPHKLSFVVPGRPGTLMWYFNDCFGNMLSPVHPATVAFDAYYALAKSNMSLHPLWLSEPVPLPATRTSKTDFALSEDQYQKCVSMGAQVRYLMVSFTTATHPSLRIPVENYAASRSFNFTEAMSIGAAVVSVLKELHSMNITHRNLNRKEFSLHKNSGENTAVLSIQGLEFSSIGGYRDRESVWRSPWEMAHPSHPYTKRDDVYRAIEMVAALLIGEDLETAYLAMPAQRVLLFKVRDYIFGHPSPDAVNVHKNLLLTLKTNPLSVTRAHVDLASILSHIRTVEPESTNYDYIISVFRGLSQLENPAKPSKQPSRKRPRS